MLIRRVRRHQYTASTRPDQIRRTSTITASQCFSATISVRGWSMRRFFLKRLDSEANELAANITTEQISDGTIIRFNTMSSWNRFAKEEFGLYACCWCWRLPVYNIKNNDSATSKLHETIRKLPLPKQGVRDLVKKAK